MKTTEWLKPLINIYLENKFNKYFYNLLNRNAENTGILLKIVRNGNFFLKYAWQKSITVVNYLYKLQL